jgi:hypothetical protein
MGKRKKATEPLFGIWLDGRRLGGAFVLDEALALLGACARRWERENASATTQLGAVQSADGSLYLCAPVLLRRDDERALTEADWENVRATVLESARRPWNVKIPPRGADRIVAAWSFGVDWKATPITRRAPRVHVFRAVEDGDGLVVTHRMEPDEDAPQSTIEMYATQPQAPVGRWNQ